MLFKFLIGRLRLFIIDVSGSMDNFMFKFLIGRLRLSYKFKQAEQGRAV